MGRGLRLANGKEMLTTTALDAEPDAIMKMPEDSLAPLLTALAATAIGAATQEAHIAEHLTLLVSACAFWAVAFGELTRLSRGGRLMFVSTAALLSALPGALISIAPRPLYSAHAGATAQYGLTPLADQQIAGLVMWIPAGFIYLAAILGLVFLWLRHAEQGRSARGAALSADAGFVLLSGYSDEKALERAARAAGATGDPQKGA